jgi:hypothetical protein
MAVPRPKVSNGVTQAGMSPLATIATKAAKDAPLAERLYPSNQAPAAPAAATPAAGSTGAQA